MRRRYRRRLVSAGVGQLLCLTPAGRRRSRPAPVSDAGSPPARDVNGGEDPRVDHGRVNR